MLATAERLLEDFWSRRGAPLTRAEAVGEVVSMAAFVPAAVALLVLAPDPGRGAGLGLVLAFTLAFAVAVSVRFPIGVSSAVPATLVLVPMYFALPPAIVPVCVFAAMAATSAVGPSNGMQRRWRVMMSASDSWHALSGAVVLVLAGAPTVTEATPLVLLATLAAMIGTDWLNTLTRERVVSGEPMSRQVGVVAQSSILDAAVAPVGFAAAHAGRAGVLLVLPLVGLLALIARDRTGRIDRAHQRLVELEHFRRQAVTDDLTGLANHRHLQEALDERLAAPGAVVSLVLLDVDDFKAVNDRHGHAMGDELLRAVGGALGVVAARHGLAARYGGEEFALVVDGDLEAARRLAERACAAIRAIRVEELRVTASCGAATGTVKDALFADADAALYAAKRAGKDRVAAAPAAPVPLAA